MSDDLTQQIQSMLALIEEQANDPGLWFIADTGPEAYLQQALRKLHAEVERLEKLQGVK